MSLFTLLFCFGTMSVSAFAVQDSGVPIRLERKFKLGETLNYRNTVVMKGKVSMPNGLGDQDINVVTVSRMKQKIVSISKDGKTANIVTETIIEAIKSEGPQTPGSDISVGKTIKATGIIDRLGGISLDGGDTSGNPMMALFNLGSNAEKGSLPAFPSGPRRIGEAWSLPQMNVPFLRATTPFQSVISAFNSKVAEVTSNGTFSLDMDLSKIAGQGKAVDSQADPMMSMMGQMKMDGLVNTSSRTTFDRETGAIVNMEQNNTMKLNMTMEQFQSDVKMNMVMSSITKRI